MILKNAFSVYLFLSKRLKFRIDGDSAKYYKTIFIPGKKSSFGWKELFTTDAKKRVHPLLSHRILIYVGWEMQREFIPTR